MPVKCIACDMDFTLAHWVSGFDSIVRIFTNRGIDPELAQVAFDEVNRTGFSIANYRAQVERYSQRSLADQAEQIEREFERCFRGAFRAYDDSLGWLTRWRARGTKVAVLSFGVPEFQRQKVDLLRLPHDDLFLVREKVGKIEALRMLLTRYLAPIVTINDDERELDAVRDAGLDENQVVTVLITRPDKVRKAESHHSHFLVQNLAEADALLQRF